MNNTLKGILAGIFVLLIVLLLLSRCTRCTDDYASDRPDVPADTTDARVDEPVAEPQPEPVPDDDMMPPADSIGVDGRIKVTMQWNWQGDMDLHAEQPDGEHIYYLNKQPGGPNAGELDLDNIPGGRGSAENINWQNPAPGNYRIYIKYFSSGDGDGRGGDVLVTVKIDGRETQYRLNPTHENQVLDVVSFTYPQSN